MAASLRTALAFPALAAALALTATAADAQVQQNDPNAANASLARQGEVRAMNQARVSNFNTLNMRIQRNVQFRPVETYPYAGIRAYPRGRGHGIHRGGLNTSICTGC